MSTSIQANKRNLNLDLIRTVAVYSVLSVHFFLNTEFYNTPILGKKMYLATIMRNMFMVCVPLFLLLTGYLMNKKTLTKSYYQGIKKTLIPYVIATLFILIFRIFVMKEHISIFDMLINITSFQHYSWYIEMYIELFLLIPFLNLIYSNLSNKHEKLILIITLLVLTTLPSLLNTFDFKTSNWFFYPASSNSYQKLVPSWWTNLYPLTYYYIGAYIQEFQNDITLSLKYNFILLSFSLLIFGSYSYYRSYNSCFIWGNWCDWNGFGTVITTVLLFIYLLRINLAVLPNFAKNCLVSISKLSLSIYLVSWIFDKYNYPILNLSVPVAADRLPFYFIIVPLNFLCGYVLSILIDKISTKLYDLSKKSTNKPLL